MNRRTKMSELMGEALQGRLSRREVLRRATVLGLSAPAISALLAACGDDDDDAEAEPTAEDGEPAAGEEASPTPAEEQETEPAAEEEPEATPTEAEAEEPAGDRQTLIFGLNAADLGTLDPHFAATTNDRTVVDMIFNGLLRYKPGDSSEIEPDLAEEVPEPEMQDDGTQTWTFTLKQGVMWQPGPQTDSYELTADDVIYSFEKAADPDRSAYAGEYEGLTFEKVDDYTVTVTADPPLSPLLFLPKVVDYAGGFIVSQQAVEAMGADAIATAPVGTGPFMFQDYTAQNAIELVAFDDYFRGAPQLAGVSLRFMPDVTSRELALQSGEIHAGYGLSEAQWVDRVSNMDNVEVDVFGVGEVAFVNFNIDAEPLNDPNVRKALAYAISRDGHLALFGAPVAENVYSVVPAQLLEGGLTQEEAAEREVLYEQDIERASQMLADAGYEDGFSLQLVTSESDSYRKNYETMQAEFREIGVDIQLEVLDHSTYHSQIREDVNPIVIYIAWRPNADVYLTRFFHSASTVVTGENPDTNFSHYDQIDDLIEEARASTDPEEQAEIWKEANTQILEDMAAYPLHFINQVYARQSNVDYGHELVSSLALYPQITENTTITEE